MSCTLLQYMIIWITAVDIEFICTLLFCFFLNSYDPVTVIEPFLAANPSGSRLKQLLPT